MKTKINILSIDSGGVRNLISAYILQKIEEQLQEQQNNPYLRIADVFDTFLSIGSSTLLSYLYQIPLTDNSYRDSQFVFNEYQKIAKRIYRRKNLSYLPYRTLYCSNQNLQRHITELFQNLENVKNKKNNVVPLFNLSKGNLEIIAASKSILSAEEIVKASLATYPFFKHVRIDDMVYASGEYVSANPKFCLNHSLLIEACKNYDEVNILSIGAGSNTIHSTNNSIKRIAKDCATQFVEENFLPNQTVNYFRIDVPTKDFDMFKPLHTNSYIDFSTKNIKAMHTAGQLAMGATNKKELESFLAVL